MSNVKKGDMGMGQSPPIPEQRQELGRRLFVLVGMHPNGLTYKQIKRRYGLTKEEVQEVLEDTKALMGEDGFSELYILTDKRLKVRPAKPTGLVSA